jgi:hypothetical protein
MIVNRYDYINFIDLMGDSSENLLGYNYSALIATKTHVFSLHSKENKKSRVTNLTGYPCAIGSSAHMLNGLMSAGMHPLDAYPILNLYDIGTGKDAEEFDLLSLNDFLVDESEFEKKFAAELEV